MTIDEITQKFETYFNEYWGKKSFLYRFNHCKDEERGIAYYFYNITHYKFTPELPIFKSRVASDRLSRDYVFEMEK